jgi:hypothetical protein
MGVRVTLATEYIGGLGFTEGELVAESSGTLTVSVKGVVVMPLREGTGVAVVAYLDPPVMVLGVFEGPPDADGIVRLRRVKPRS